MTASRIREAPYSWNFVPRMHPPKLVEGYKRVLRTIYNSRDYYQRALDSQGRVAAGEVRRQRNIVGVLVAFLRIDWMPGIREPDRMEFWGYVGRVLARHRARFTEAMTLAAMRYHFRKLTESVTA